MIEKTDWKMYFSTLSDECLQDIFGHLHREVMKREIAKFESTLPPLNDNEVALVKGNKYIDAIKEYRGRTRVDLRAAKTIVDIYKNGIK